MCRPGQALGWLWGQGAGHHARATSQLEGRPLRCLDMESSPCHVGTQDGPPPGNKVTAGGTQKLPPWRWPKPFLPWYPPCPQVCVSSGSPGPPGAHCTGLPLTFVLASPRSSVSPGLGPGQAPAGRTRVACPGLPRPPLVLGHVWGQWPRPPAQAQELCGDQTAHQVRVGAARGREHAGQPASWAPAPNSWDPALVQLRTPRAPAAGSRSHP